jgi:hypothetical protein
MHLPDAPIEVRTGTVRPDDGAIPALGSQSVVVDVWIPGGVSHINRRMPMFPRDMMGGRPSSN